MKFILVFITSGFLITGCATSKMIPGPNGKPAYAISCGSAVIEGCWEEASKVCPQGYKSLENAGNPNAMITPVGNSIMLVKGRNKMLIECK